MYKILPYKKLLKYPHMKPLDVAIWERFVVKYPNLFTMVIYDYHVGEGADFLPTGTETPDGRENRLYQKKIDVLGFKVDEMSIIEVKPRADIKALGQVITYEKLLTDKIARGKTVRKMVVCEGIDSDMREVYNHNKIDVFIV